MPSISDSTRLIIWIVSGIAGVILAALSIYMEENIRHSIRKLFRQDRGGRRPARKPAFVWFIYILVALTSILGASVASTASSENGVKPTEVVAPTVIIEEDSHGRVEEQLQAEVPTPFVPSPSSNLENILKISTRYNCALSTSFWIPSNIDLKESPAYMKENLDVAKKIYEQKAWQDWILLDFTPGLEIDLTNAQILGGPIILDNEAEIVIDHYEPLKHIDVGWFALDLFYPGDSGCGGGAGFAREFSTVKLANKNNLVSIASENDYYVLEAGGEFERFSFYFECGEPGIYSYHIQLPISYLGDEKELTISPVMYTYCPESISYWSFLNSVEIDIQNDVWEPHSILFSGNYRLSNIQNNDVSSNDFFNGPYVLSQLSETWDYTEPWQACPNAPLSYIYDRIRFSNSAIINPSLDSYVNIRSGPGLSFPITYRKSPGSFVWIWGSPNCFDNLVWWLVEWNAGTGDTVELVEGWIAEANQETRFLTPCLITDQFCENR